MFRSILKWLPEYRALENDLTLVREALQSSVQEKLRLEDRIEGVLSDRAKLWETMQESLRGERYAYQSEINTLFQRNGAGVPYPDAYKIPRNPVANQSTDPVGRNSRILPSEMMSRATEKFVREYAETFASPVENQ